MVIIFYFCSVNKKLGNMALSKRIYTAGRSDFKMIRERNCIYVDKTELIYDLTHESQYVFLSRPRRFGKTLLCSTLQYYFEGRKELFEGLRMAELETEWKHYPVMRFDISACKNQADMAGIVRSLELYLERYEKLYGRNENENSPGKRLAGLIERAHEQTGLPAVVIIDEYDSVLLEYLDKPGQLEEVRRILQEFYQTLKICDAHLQFAFITGITKFSQLSIFSTINNLRNISMKPKYAALCGFTEEELYAVFDPDVAMLAAQYGCSKEEMYAKLKQKYDGYYFTSAAQNVYNPFSLTNAFMDMDLSDYWFTSGTPSYLFSQMKHFNTNVLSLSQLEVSANDFDVPTEAMTTALPLLYQSGYLTIKRYDREGDVYTLDFPNAEVKVGFLQSFMQMMLNINVFTDSFAGKFYAHLLRHETDAAMQDMKAFFASIPYLENGSRELDDLTKLEAYYEVIFFIVFSVINCRTYTQVKSVRGRCDVVVFLPDATYVMELKIDRPAAEALDQIDTKGYAIPYAAEGKRIVKIGVSFSSASRTVEEYLIK